jgi:nucleotide-binding universal stress UspA family protein
VVLLRVACYDAREKDQMQREVSRAQRALREAREMLANTFALEAEEVLMHGDPAETIIEECASRGCDLIAMSTHGHGALYDFLLGSVANQVRHRVNVPVLTMRVALKKGKRGQSE